MEVDFIIGEKIAIEVKATQLVDEKDIKGLRTLATEAKMDRLIILSRDPERRRIGQIEIIPYREFLSELWSGRVI